MKQAMIPVDCDGVEPQVCVIEVKLALFSTVFLFTATFVILVVLLECLFDNMYCKSISA